MLMFHIDTSQLLKPPLHIFLISEAVLSYKILLQLYVITNGCLTLKFTFLMKFSKQA